MTMTATECREARRKLGLSVRAMARAIGTSPRTITRYENPDETGPEGAAATLYRQILAGNITIENLTTGLTESAK